MGKRVVLICCVAFAAMAAQASAAITIESGDGDTLATFKKVRCFKYNRQGGFAALARKHGWEFRFAFIRFDGYTRHALRYSPKYWRPLVQVEDLGSSGELTQYGNIFAPDRLRGEPAGHVSFPGKGKQLKLDLHFAYTAGASDDPPILRTVDVSGTATCAWRGKKPRG